MVGGESNSANASRSNHEIGHCCPLGEDWIRSKSHLQHYGYKSFSLLERDGFGKFENLLLHKMRGIPSPRNIVIR